MGSMFDTKRYLQKLRAHWPWWVALGLLVFIAGNAAGLLLPNKYQCRALIRILPPLTTARDANLLDPKNELRVIRDRITQPSYYDQGDQNGQSIIGELNLAKGISRNSIEYQSLKNGIASRMSVWPRTDNLVQLTYWDYKPELAYNILNASIKKWCTETEQSIGKMANNNRALLDTQLRQAQDKLTSASAAVLAYKTSHPEVTPEAYAEYRSQRDELIRTRTKNEQTIKALQDSIVLAEARLKREASTITRSTRTRTDQPEIRQMQVELARMDRQMQLYLMNFKENHPKVKELKANMATLKEAIDKASKDGGYKDETFTENNPAYQTIKNEIESLQMQLGQTRTMVQEADKEIARLDAYITTIPAKQSAYNELLREESLYRTEVDNLKTKLVSAEYIDNPNFQNQFGFSIAQLEAPEKPLAPAAPNRAKIAALSAGLGLAAVAAVAWLLMILDMAVRSVDEARQILRMPVLGVVQPIQTAAGGKRRRIAA
ncbi:MAG: hypothetical protein ABFD69_02985 [Candidatus Sumerlaeia bacterium]